jgi:hypothetical protein
VAVTSEPNVNLALHIGPLLGLAQLAYEFLEGL